MILPCKSGGGTVKLPLKRERIWYGSIQWKTSSETYTNNTGITRYVSGEICSNNGASSYWAISVNNVKVLESINEPAVWDGIMVELKPNDVFKVEGNILYTGSIFIY